LLLLSIDEEVKKLADQLISKGGFPAGAEADALHVAAAAVHRVDYLLTWNSRHIDNSAKKPIIRSICIGAGYSYPGKSVSLWNFFRRNGICTKMMILFLCK
jgi:hypothetical protein